VAVAGTPPAGERLLPVTDGEEGVYDAVVLDKDGVLVGRTPFDTLRRPPGTPS